MTNETGAPFVADTPLVTRLFPSANVEPRREGFHPDILLLHYTGMPSAEAAIRWLAAPESRVSCHYVIDEEGVITQMVPERLRAWHAGASHWKGVDDINSCSVGIEIQNPGHDGGYPPFPERQMIGLEALCLDIVRRHGIKPQRVLDPGEKFDWARLAKAGVGHWITPSPVSGGPALVEGDSGTSVMRLQRQLRAYGYWIEATGVYDDHTRIVVEAFQRHFRPALVDGRADRSTVETLDALLAALPEPVSSPSA
jgi:N-acetylmuramoyl-L-alanine amidase